jgi:hypothetical protein
LEPFGTADFFKILSDHNDNLFGKLSLLTLHIRRRHSGILFSMNVLNGANCCPLSQKGTEFVFLLGTYVTLPCSVAPTATGRQQDAFLLVIEFKSRDIFRISPLY